MSLFNSMSDTASTTSAAVADATAPTDKTTPAAAAAASTVDQSSSNTSQEITDAAVATANAWYAQLAAASAAQSSSSQSLVGPQTNTNARGAAEQFDGGKVFVSGLSPYTDETRMSAFFSQFGTVRETRIMRDRTTLESRCFGFVTFVDHRIVDSLVNDAELTIDGRAVQLKRAIAMEATATRDNNEPEQDALTLFIGRIPPHVTDVRLRDIFAHYANIDSAQVMKDRLTGVSRGFGFVRLQSLTDVDTVLRIHAATPIVVDNAEVKVIKAEPKPNKRERVMNARQRQTRVQPYAAVPGMPTAGYGAAAAAYAGGGYDYAAAAAAAAAYAPHQAAPPRQAGVATAATTPAQVYQQQLAAYQAYQQAVMTAYQQQQQQLMLQQQQQQQHQQRRK